MGILDPAKLAVVLLIAFVVLGPDRLPEAARWMGSMWNKATHLREQAEREVRSSVESLNLPNIPDVRPSRMMSNFLGELTRDSAETSASSTSKVDSKEPSAVLSAINKQAAEPHQGGTVRESSEAEPIVSSLTVHLDSASLN